MDGSIAYGRVDSDCWVVVSHFSTHDIREPQCSFIRKCQVARVTLRRVVNFTGPRSESCSLGFNVLTGGCIRSGHAPSFGKEIMIDLADERSELTLVR